MKHLRSQFGEIDRRTFMPLLAAGAALLVRTKTALAQQYPIPQTADQVPGPPPGTAMTKAYVQSAGRTAYLWGWPLVNVSNRAAAFSKAPEPGLLGGIIPVAFGRNAMLTNYISAEQTFIVCPNQDVVLWREGHWPAVAWLGGIAAGAFWIYSGMPMICHY
jgi:hypothetical protein